ncbi:unnamed protein product [Closterium sp. NIES-54]
MMSGLLLLLVGSVAAARARVARVVAVAAGGGGGGGGGEGGGGGGRGGSGGGSGGFGGGGGGSGGSGGGGGGGSGSGGGSSGGGRGGAVQRGGSGSGHRQQQQQRQSKTPTPQQLRGWFALRGAPGEAAALGASESALPSTVPAEALHTFTLDSGASRGFFHDSTTLTPLLAPIPVRLADPSGGPVLARSSIVLPCPAGPSGSLSGLHLPSFSTNLVSTATLQDAMVTTTTPGGQRVSICTCTRTGRHLATFTRRPGSSLYTLTTEPPQVAAPAQVSASGPVASPRSSHLLLHQTLLWHHRLGHPSLPRLRGMHSCLLVSGLPRSLPPLPPSPAPPYLPCVEGRQRAAPHSSSFPRTTAPLQTLYMDVWGSARVKGQDRERYFLLAVDDYTRYTTSVSSSVSGSVRTFLSCICTLTEVYGRGHATPPETAAPPAAPAAPAPAAPPAPPPALATPAPAAPPAAPATAAPPVAPVPPAPAAPPVAPAAPLAPPAALAPAAPPAAPAPAAPPAAPVPATPPAAPAPPAAPTAPPAAPAAPAPAATRQRREYHSRSRCGEGGSCRDTTPRAPPDSVRAGSAPPDTVPSGSPPPGSARPDSAPPDSAPLCLPGTHLRRQDPGGGGALPGEYLVRGKAAGGREAVR